ncbi:MAG: LON peptidase substrate-binding domain-containing protein [Candidatus Promineifilaceae bacterium]|nr:LON peptidase substrate-binding domain-containing protein [Candidatus Promineifilaceae bacterium]
MYELPLFPLNTVLFPGMPLTLHIFEDRYKRMIGECIETESPFGVVLIKEGLEALGPLADPHPVGCTAHIMQVERLSGGRMNIGAIGRERFRIVELDRSQAYLAAKVEPFPLVIETPANGAVAARRLLPWVIRYMDELSQVEGVDLDPQELPDEPLSLAYLAATLLQVPAEQKQSLLDIQAVTTMLTDMRALYRREVAFLKAMFAQNLQDEGTFSLN